MPVLPWVQRSREESMRRITAPPEAFDGTLRELHAGWAEKVMLEPDVVEQFHHLLVTYLEAADPLFLIRMVKGTERGTIVRTASGQRLVPTDNAPSWWIHRELFAGRVPARAAFDAFVEEIPSHMFRMPKGENISVAGWHVAHIFEVKNGDVSFSAWDRQELVWRMVRNIHPCNYFFVPKQDWQRHGGDPRVIAFFYERFAVKYHAIWAEFLTLAAAAPQRALGDASEHRIAYQPTSRPDLPQRGRGLDVLAACYSFSRLCFKANVIEPLGMSDRFGVVTPIGTFVFSKMEFYEEFPRVVASASYRVNGQYHFPKPPARAMRFMVSDDDSARSR
jgi:hypothetical protein